MRVARMLLPSIATLSACATFLMLPATAGAGDARFGLRHVRQTETAIVTNATSGWLVQKPSRKRAKPAVATDTNVLWAPALNGSTWIAPKILDGVKNVKAGIYTYIYTFCPALASGTPSISLTVLADNAFDIQLNGHDFDPTPFLGYNGSIIPFQVPQTVSTSLYFLTAGLNELTIEVENGPGNSPTGLDVSGTVDDIQPSCSRQSPALEAHASTDKARSRAPRGTRC